MALLVKSHVEGLLCSAIAVVLTVHWIPVDTEVAIAKERAETKGTVDCL